MSRAISIQWRQIASQIYHKVSQARLAANVDLPSGLGPVSQPLILLDKPFGGESDIFSEHLIPLMSDGFRVEDISVQSLDPVFPAETFMPFEYRVPPAKPDVWEEKEKGTSSPGALPERKISALPAAGHQAVKVSSEKYRGEAESLDGLLSYLKAQGLKVKEVKSVSEGTTRITLDEYLGRREPREPEFVRVR